ncbi:hypothetical protein VKT23_009672 [Stygiomarasmius scandens]|uniref:Uncharacterized protein n=1 Tax=Marasmiellus scandens TaxID=2682957 RepID=A0ABR1JFN7_9AGAR
MVLPPPLSNNQKATLQDVLADFLTYLCWDSFFTDFVRSEVAPIPIRPSKFIGVRVDAAMHR